MHFNTTENEPSIMNIIWHTLWQTEAQRASWDKFCFKATLLAQDTFTFPNTTCIAQDTYHLYSTVYEANKPE